MAIKKIFIQFFMIFTAFLGFAWDKPVASEIQALSGTSGNITVSWKLPLDTKNKISRINLYRTLEPVTDIKQIQDKTPVAVLEKDATGYVDKVPNYKDFFYTVILIADSRVNSTVIPSQNATIKGVHIFVPDQKPAEDVSYRHQEKMYPEGSLRETPLPFLDIIENQNKNKIKMSLQAQSASKNFGTDKDSRISKAFTKPYIFEEDLVSPENGDDVFLFEILKNYFIQKKYSESQTELIRLLGTNIDRNVLNRATFYLGEACYFQGNYQNAVKNFLKTSEIFPLLSKKWIDSSLDLLVLPEY